MSDWRVNLDIFAGPLDLLLYLVRKNELDIYDIPIAQITEQYIQYIEMLKSLDIDLAGDFMVMAATLMQIKSAMLLPQESPDELEGEALDDPRAELIRQLLEYKKFKDAANLLNAAADGQKERFARPGTIVNMLKPDAGPKIDIEHVSVWDLLEAFDSLMEQTGSRLDVSHITDDTPIDLYQIEILHRLQTEETIRFEQLFESRASRAVMIGLFLALLELIREMLVSAEQGRSAAMYLRALTDEPAEQAVQKAIVAAEADNHQSKAKQTSPIPIAELPSKEKPKTTTPKYEKTESSGGATQESAN